MDQSPTPPAQAAAEAALQRGDFAGAVELYTEALDSLQLGPAAERGTLLLGRALARRLLGDGAALSDAVAALEAWRSAGSGFVSEALAEIASGLREADAGAAEAYWDAAHRASLPLGAGRAAALLAAEQGWRALDEGQADTAARELERCEELAREAGDDELLAAALLGQCRLRLQSGEPAAAARHLAQASALVPRSAQARWLLWEVGAAAARAGEADLARRLLEQCLAQGGDDLELRRRSLAELAGVLRRAGDPERARDLALEVVQLLRAEADETTVAHVLHDVGLVAMEAGMGYDAAQHLDQALALARRHRLPVLAAACARQLAALASLHGDHLRALGFAEQAAAIPLDGAERRQCALTLAAVGSDAERWQRHDIAVPAYAGAADIHRSLGDEAAAELWQTALLRARESGRAARAQRDEVRAALDTARRLSEE